MNQIFNISEAIENSKEKLTKVKEENKRQRICFQVKPDEFRELFLLSANIIIAKRNVDREFEVNDINKDVINYLYYYLIGRPDLMKWESKEIPVPEMKLDKHILLVGSVGVGKTVILKAFCDVIKLIGGKIFTQMHSKEIGPAIKREGIDFFKKRPLLVDDIGKENKEMNDYGTKSMPLVDLIELRYDSGAITYLTANYSIEGALKEFYGERIADRMKEMFNIIQLGGESFRR